MWITALRAIRANTLPGLVLWTVAGAIVAIYYLFPAAQPAFDTVAAWKTWGGFLYSILATALFAGLIPAIVTRSPLPTLIFMVLFWGYRGLEIDLFYRFQAWLFGSEANFTTIAAKVAVDMFVYNVAWAASLQLLAYHWKDAGFRRGAFRGFDWKVYWSQRWPVTLLSTWVVWLPVVSLIYSLPLPLQIPLFNLAACFWSLRKVGPPPSSLVTELPQWYGVRSSDRAFPKAFPGGRPPLRLTLDYSRRRFRSWPSRT
jgi:hypothetical protein